MQIDLRVPADAVVSKEIDISESESDVRISLEHGSSLHLVIRIAPSKTQDTRHKIQHSTSITVGSEARCTILTINAAGENSTVTISQTGSIETGGVLRWQNVSLGGKELTHDLVSRVIGANAESAVDWMFYAKGTEKQSLNARNIFEAANGSGEILMRGVAEEKGHAVAKGMIEIGLKGNGTNTYLTQQVLMLDASSKVDAVPALEIKTNDVKASHSATVARVTPEDLFYFAARGIDTHEARAMFVQGFLGDIVSRIDGSIQEEVRGMIERKYSQAL